MSDISPSTVARIRRAALRQDYILTKNRRKDPQAADYGTYRLVDITRHRPDPTRGRMTLQQVADYLEVPL